MSVLALALKDLKVDYRSKQLWGVLILLSLVIVLAFRFAFPEGELTRTASADLVSSGLWISFSFSAILGMYTAFQKEKENDALTGLRLCPVDGGEIFFGKMLAVLVAVGTIDLLSVILFGVFFNFDYGGRLLEILALSLLGSLALASVGTLIGGLTVHVRGGEVLLPILMLPLVTFTIIMPGIAATRSLLSGGTTEALAQLGFIVGAFIVYTAIGYAAFDYILEE